MTLLITLYIAKNLRLMSIMRCDFKWSVQHTLLFAALVFGGVGLKKLEQNLRVLTDRPDDPMKGIRGPAKHSLRWVEKWLAKFFS